MKIIITLISCVFSLQLTLIAQVKYELEDSVFTEGFKRVAINKKLGYINTQRKEITPIIYDNGDVFSEGLAMVLKNNKAGFIDVNGKEVIELKFEYAQSFSEGKAIVSQNNKVGFIDKTGKVVIDYKYENAAPFVNGVALVVKNKKYGYINNMGKEITEFIYDEAYSFVDDRAIIKQNDRYGAIDKTGKLIIPNVYRYPFTFTDGLAIVQNEQFQFGAIDKKGGTVIDFKFVEIVLIDKNLMVAAIGKSGSPLSEGGDFFGKLGYTFQLFNSSGKASNIYQTIMYRRAQGLSIVRNMDRKYGIINNQFTETVACQYYDINNAYEELYIAKDTYGKLGYINATGKIIIPFIYNKARWFENGKAQVTLNDKTFYINKKGETVKP